MSGKFYSIIFFIASITLFFVRNKILTQYIEYYTGSKSIKEKKKIELIFKTIFIITIIWGIIFGVLFYFE